MAYSSYISYVRPIRHLGLCSHSPDLRLLFQYSDLELLRYCTHNADYRAALRYTLSLSYNIRWRVVRITGHRLIFKLFTGCRPKYVISVYVLIHWVRVDPRNVCSERQGCGINADKLFIIDLSISFEDTYAFLCFIEKFSSRTYIQ